MRLPQFEINFFFGIGLGVYWDHDTDAVIVLLPFFVVHIG